MKRKVSGILTAAAAAVALLAPAGCSTSRHVPEGEYLLDKVKIDVDPSTGTDEVTLINYLRQQPNHVVLGFAKLQLGIYNMSGRDTTRWYNRWARSLGQAPVIFDHDLTEQSRRQLELALVNKGYTNTHVTVDSVFNRKDRKVELIYHINSGEPHIIRNIAYEFDDPGIGEVIMADKEEFTIAEGTPLNRDLLENERVSITSRLRDKGYYNFAKEQITFIADTTATSKDVDLTMRVLLPQKADSTYRERPLNVSRVVYRVESPDHKPGMPADTVSAGKFTVIYDDDRYLKLPLLEEKCFIRPGEPYSATDVNRTYEALTQLAIVKYVNIAMVPETVGGEPALEAVITLSRTKKQGVTFEVEGTNSEGDLGFGVGVTYQHRDLARGAEVLTAKVRTSYESLSGKPTGIINDRYTEVAAEVGITFPKFEAPFLSKSFKQRSKAQTEFAVSFNYQERPEYTRVISGAAWKYRWNDRANMHRNTFDLIDLNYVYLPKSTIDFINTVAPQNPLLRYSYEDHLIMRMGYSIYRTNRRPVTTGSRMFGNPFQQKIWTLRASVETAGNLLYALSSLTGQNRHGGAYKVFNTQYAQYAKFDFDYSWVYNFNSRNSIALHGGFGVGVPYGNSEMIPFEKRFYAGGANSVRGWGVRTLGPGAYDARNSVIDFINQCGDIRLDLNVEYRAKLFWVIEGALFIDAGNIWTIHNYENQPGGMFRFNTFYKQIAAAYGAGIRFDFTYFLLRLDLGMKAHNPAYGQEKWPLLHPRWGRDKTIHFSIGYPF